MAGGGSCKTLRDSCAQSGQACCARCVLQKGLTGALGRFEPVELARLLRRMRCIGRMLVLDPASVEHSARRADPASWLLRTCVPKSQCHDGEHMCTSVMHVLRGSRTLSSPFTINSMGTGGLKALPITHYVAACRPASWRSLSGSAQNRPVFEYFRDDRLASVRVATGKGAAVEETVRKLVLTLPHARARSRPSLTAGHAHGVTRGKFSHSVHPD